MYNKKETRPYIGIVLEIKDFFYFAPMTSPKMKFKNIKPSSMHIYRIDNGNLGYICLNNMIPLTKLPPLIDVKNQKLEYANLLNKQLIYLKKNSDKISKNALKIYTRYRKIKGLKNICVDFRYLEYCAKCYDYAINNNIIINLELINTIKFSKNFEAFKSNFEIFK